MTRAVQWRQLLQQAAAAHCYGSVVAQGESSGRIQKVSFCPGFVQPCVPIAYTEHHVAAVWPLVTMSMYIKRNRLSNIYDELLVIVICALLSSSPLGSTASALPSLSLGQQQQHFCPAGTAGTMAVCFSCQAASQHWGQTIPRMDARSWCQHCSQQCCIHQLNSCSLLCLLSLPCIEATTSHEDEGEEEWGATMHAPLAEAPGGLHWPTLWRALLLCVHCPCRLTSAVTSHHCALSWHTDNPSEQLQFHGGYIKNVTSTAITAAISSGCLPCRGTCVPTASTWAWKAGCCYCKWTLQFVSVRKLEKFMKEEKGWGTGRQKTHRLAGKGWIQEKRRWIGARFEG